MIKALIFDYDGVIVDSFPNCFEVYKIICKDLGKKCPSSINDFKRIYGYNSIEAYQNLGIAKEDYEKAGKIYKREILKLKPRLFEGIDEVLKKLSKRYNLILISSSYREEVEQKLKNYKIFEYFSALIGKETHDDHFNKSDSIKKTLKELKFSSEEVILIGDRDVDYNEGTEAGLKNILLVEYGWGYNQKNVPPQKMLILEPRDLIKAISLFE